MQWAEGGSLDDYIDARLGRPTHPPHHGSTQEDDPSSDLHSRSARIRAFRAMQRAAPSEKQAIRAKLNNIDGNTWTAVHLLSAEEVLGIFGGVAAGLGFLVRIIYLPIRLCDVDHPLEIQHDKSILHLDLKPGNVLLTWDEATLMYAYFLFCCSYILKTSQPACDALRLWYLPRYDANSRREKWQHGNVSPRNYSALRLLANVVHLVSNTVLQNRFPSHRTTPSLRQIQSRICGLSA